MKSISEKTNWNNIKQQVLALNPELYEIIEELKPNNLPITLAKYQYGSVISDDKHFYLPNAQGEIEAKPVNEFPYVFVVDKNIEIYDEKNDRVKSRRIYPPGSIFPFTADINKQGNLSPRPKSIFTITSGIRNLNILSISSNSDAYRKFLKEYNLDNSLQADNHLHHFHIAKGIISALNYNWECTVFMFGKEWKKNIIENPKWYKLNKFMFRQTITKNAFKEHIDFLDDALNDIISDNNIKVKHYTIEAFKQLMLMAFGNYPGFKPSIDNEGIPLDCLTDALINSYQNSIVPIIVESTMQNPSSDNLPIYHSLWISSSNKMKTFRPTTYLDELAENIDFILESFKSDLYTSSSAYGQLKKVLDYKFYSSLGDNTGTLRESVSLIKDDKRFSDLIKKLNSSSSHDEVFPKRSLFTKALIAISFNKHLDKL